MKSPANSLAMICWGGSSAASVSGSSGKLQKVPSRSGLHCAAPILSAEHRSIPSDVQNWGAAHKATRMLIRESCELFRLFSVARIEDQLTFRPAQRAQPRATALRKTQLAFTIAASNTEIDTEYVALGAEPLIRPRIRE